MPEKTDMNLLIRRKAFGVRADEMSAEIKQREDERAKKPTNMTQWLQEQYLASRGITVKNDDEEGEH